MISIIEYKLLASNKKKTSSNKNIFLLSMATYIQSISVLMNEPLTAATEAVKW